MNQKYYYVSLMKCAIFYNVLFHVLRTAREATKAKLETQNFTGLTKDDILGDLLYTTALSYHAELGIMNQVSAKIMGLVAITYPSETMFSYELKSNYYFGIPVSVSPSGLAMDADRLMTMVRSPDGDTEKPKQFMLNAGSTGSALEHSVPEQLWSTPENPAQGISAVKALQIANDQGIPVYTINKDNINTILPQLQIDYDDKTDIKNAVNAGKEVTVSKTNITFNGWSGVGYIVIDPKTGAGGYMISGGMSGAIIGITLLSYLIPLVFLCLTFTGIPALLFGGALIVWSMVKYINKINEYIDKMLSGDITEEKAQSLIKFRSITTIIINALSPLGKDSIFRYGGLALMVLSQYVVDAIELLFEWAEEQKS